MRFRLGLALAAALAAPAHAVVILDSTWAQEGGTKQYPALGFAAHIAFAHRPQFDAAIAFTSDGDTWGDCSGAWIGNDATSGYVLTAAHCISGRPATVYAYRTEGGSVLIGSEVFVNPQWTGDFAQRTGYDLAIIKLGAPVTDGGQPPLLYDGNDEKGRLLTFVGFGSRGIGSTAEQPRFYDGGKDWNQKAAGQGRIDEVVPADSLNSDDAGNYFSIYLPKEDGSIPNPWGGETKPASRLAGLLGSGDSGSSAWLQLNDGRWVIAGVASDGSSPGGYGDQSWFVRLSHHRAWIVSIVPSARFAHD